MPTSNPIILDSLPESRLAWIEIQLRRAVLARIAEGFVMTPFLSYREDFHPPQCCLLGALTQSREYIASALKMLKISATEAVELEGGFLGFEKPRYGHPEFRALGFKLRAEFVK